MIPFLYQVAKVFYAQQGNELYRHTFVFPNRRAGAFFQKYLAEIAGKPLFSPRVITIRELFESFSPYRPADHIELLVMLYRQFLAISDIEESFDDFLYWGEMLLNDFDDTDKYLADARQLYRNVQDFRSLDDDLSHLTEQQIIAIRRFWSHFMPVEGNETKERFQHTWKMLYELYTAFRASLQASGMAYEGMIFREVAERAKAGLLQRFDTEGYVFVGLHALTPAEIQLMKQLRNQGIADFYWDYDSPFVRDEKNRASYWVKENLSLFPSRFSLCEAEQLRQKPRVELVGISSGVGQARHVTQILSELLDSGAIPDPEEAIRTAVVLPDESLLLPVLYSIPGEISKINVTMGYGLSQSSVASLVEHLALMQQNLRSREGEPAFFHRYVKALLSHPMVSAAAPVETEQLKHHILSNNRIVVTRAEIPPHPMLQLIFTPIARWEEIPSYLQEIFASLYQNLTGKKQAEEDASVVSSRSIDLEREFIVQYHKTVTRLQDRLQQVQQMTVETCFRLLRNLARSISVAFSGEPLSGLQVMGVLETRALDFENLIILSFNEGILPQRNRATSFIPYTLRKGFGLPTYEQQDGTFAYHFYRMISRAKRIYLLYDTRTEEMQTGEVSRYFYQLKYLYKDAFQIREQIATYDVAAPQVPPVSVIKNEKVMRKLEAFRAGNERSLSASLVNNYINCPLQFYFTAVEGLSEEEAVEETVEADVFGSIFHRLMESLYNRYREMVITPDLLTLLAKNESHLDGILQSAFARYYFRDEDHPRPLQGQHYLIGEILKSYVKQTLEMDKQFTPFTYIASEYRFRNAYRVNEELELNFKGSIDRVDQVGKSVRIIDYKTGKGDTRFRNMESLFDATKANRPYQILQVLIYGLFYLQKNPGTLISPALYYLRSVYDQSDPVICFDKHPIQDLSLLLPEFRQHFDALLEEVFDPAVPFTQTKNSRNCEWCAFRELCNR